MVSMVRKRLDAERAERNNLVGRTAFSEINFDGLVIPVVSTARPAYESTQAHNAEKSAGMRMTILSLRRVSCLEKDDA